MQRNIQCLIVQKAEKKSKKKQNHKTESGCITNTRKHDRNKLDQRKIMRQYMSNLFRNCIITHYCLFQLLEYLKQTKLEKTNLHFVSNSKRLIYFKRRR